MLLRLISPAIRRTAFNVFILYGHRFGQEAHEVGFTKTQMLRIRK